MSTWGTSTVLIVWPTAIWWVNVPSSGPQYCFSAFWVWQVFNSWLLLSSCRAEYSHRDFRLLLVKNLIEEAEKAKITPPPDWLEDQVQLQHLLCDVRSTITSNGQWNYPPNSIAVSVHLAARERAQCINTLDVMSACAWCLVSWNITQE